MKDEMCPSIDEAQKDKRWFYAPPYRNEGHRILNAQGELVAIFEDKEEAIKVCEIWNQNG